MQHLLRWPGGKKWLAKRLAPIISKSITQKYFEPFLGSGAMFFEIKPSAAVLNDINADLIRMYRTVRDSPARLFENLAKMPCSRDNYYSVRRALPQDALSMAANFLFLNRTAYGGMYRLNSKGEFNVPYGGRDTRSITGTNVIQDTSRILRKARLKCGDFSLTMNSAQRGDVVYCDPVYVSFNSSSRFIRYGWGVSDWSLQQRLKAECNRAVGRGAVVLVSNAYDEHVLELYNDVPRVVYTRHSCLNGRSGESSQIKEVLFLMGASRSLEAEIRDKLK